MIQESWGAPSLLGEPHTNRGSQEAFLKDNGYNRQGSVSGVAVPLRAGVPMCHHRVLGSCLAIECSPKWALSPHLFAETSSHHLLWKMLSISVGLIFLKLNLLG